MMNTDCLTTAEEVIATHNEIEERYNLSHTGSYSPVPQVELRELLNEADNREGLYQQAAFLLRKLITEHVFRDGNKRTAWVTTREYLESNGRRLAEMGDRVPHILRRIRRYELDEIAR